MEPSIFEGRERKGPVETETLEMRARLVNSYKEITGGWLRWELVKGVSLYRSIAFFFRYETNGREREMKGNVLRKRMSHKKRKE